MTSTPTPICGRCGRVHERCKGHKAAKRGGGPCGNHPRRNQKVCGKHGGDAPQSLAAAARRAGLVAVGETVAVYGIPRHVDPADGLIEEYWRTAGIVAGLEQLVATIPQDDLVFGVSETRVPDGAGQDGGAVTVRRAVPNVWLKLFQEERDRYAKLGIEIVRLGLEARRDEYIRAQVEVFAGVLQAPELALSQEQLVTAARLLRALGAQPRMIEAEEAPDGAPEPGADHVR